MLRSLVHPENICWKFLPFPVSMGAMSVRDVQPLKAAEKSVPSEVPRSGTD